MFVVVVRVLEERRSALDAAKADYDKLRGELSAMKTGFKESIRLLSQQNKLARSQLCELQLEVEELKQIEIEQDGRLRSTQRHRDSLQNQTQAAYL